MKRYGLIGAIAAAASALLVAACIPKKPPVRARTPLTVLVAGVRDRSDSTEVAPIPEDTMKRIAQTLAERNLRPSFLPPAEVESLFRSRKTTQHRLAALAGREQTDLVALVETSVRFYSQLNGRYRWDVEARVTIARAKALDDAASSSLSAAAFLDFDHEREPEALAQAAPRIADEVGRLTDEFLGGQSIGLLERPLDATAWTAGVPATVANDAASSKADDADSIYFVLVDRFANGDPKNDGTIDPKDPQAFHGGDLQGVLDHLDDLQSLGVKTVWLSPIFKMRTEKFHGFGAYHGYWIEDFDQVEPRFGTTELLKKLSDGLHARHMRLLLDVVLNHVAPDSELVKQHPDWFHHEGGITDWHDPTQLLNREIYGLPDLAQENPKVYDWLLTRSEAWVDRVHPDGFRLDAARHIPNSFWSKYDDAMHAKAGKDFEMIGEMFDGSPATLAKTAADAHFDAVFDFPLYYAMKDVFCDDAPPSRLAATLYADRAYVDASKLVTFLDNHDLPRLATACKDDDARVRDALAFLVTARGVPSISYGTESGLTGAKEPDNRTDMRFEPENPRRAWIAKLLALRAKHPSLAEGATQRFLALDESFLAYARVAAHEATIIAVNRGTTLAKLDLPPDLASAPATDALTGESLPGAIRVAPHSLRIVVLGPRSGFATTYTPPTRVVEFRARGELARGETAVVCGSGPELGEWDPAKGVRLSPARGGELVGRVTLPAGGAFEWKVVTRAKDGTAHWEPGPNRPLLVDVGTGPQQILAPPRLAER